MKKHIILLYIIFLSCVYTTHSQTLYVNGDSLQLTLNNYKYGIINWQYSQDKLNWENLNNSFDTVFNFNVERSGYYRASVSECDDTYFSDTTLVEAPSTDTEYTDFIGKYLASDAYGGRGPGTKGDTLSIMFISDLFQHSNLVPLNSSTFYKPFLSKTNVPTFNIIGILPGVDPVLNKEVIVISGHYDHLGTKGVNIYNGADDNASGATGVCVLARKFKDVKLKRTLLFITPGLEESGQQGTVTFIKSNEVPISNIKCVFNFDMIGRLRSDSVFFCSTKYSSDIVAKINEQNTDNLNIRFLNSGLFAGSTSDNTIYTAYQGTNNLSAFGITTGKEAQYHSPSDDWELINIQGLIKVTDLVYRIVEKLANE